MIMPYFLSIENPCKGAGFSHFEIQTVREYKQAGHDPFFEVVTDYEHCRDDCPEAIGPVLYGLYGRFQEGLVEHLADRAELDDAIKLVYNITGISLPVPQ